MLGQKYGKEIQEEVLKSVGAMLKESMRTTDFVGRMEGSRFCIAWTFTPLSGATTALERIKSKIEGKLYSTVSNENFTMDACYGVVPLSEEYLSFDDYIHASEKALRKALRTAPGHIEVPDPLDF
jgi:diguanylate cyclase (GGDEF)-like protein